MLIALWPASPAHAQLDTVKKLLFLDQPDSPGDSVRLIVSPYTLHYSPSPNHRPTWMLGAEKQYADGTLLGAAYFSNSFGQDSVTAYRGERWKAWSRYPRLYGQWTAGLMYGYKPPYNDEVPLNFRGLSPVAVLSLGWQFSPRQALQLNALGTAALMVQWSVELP